jgi:hypothetical protein
MFRILSWLPLVGLMAVYTHDNCSKPSTPQSLISKNFESTSDLNAASRIDEETLVITEIMYNSDGVDDEWVEICNTSSETQDISSFQIVSSTGYSFVFPTGASISGLDCVTVSLGSDGDGLYNNADDGNGNCLFEPDFGLAPTTVETNHLINGNGSISLLQSNGVTILDEVEYSSSDGANNNGSSLHVIDSSLDNSNTSSNWQEVDFGGSPRVNSLLPLCLPNIVEINVEGNVGNYPDIEDGDNTPNGLDNTLFSAQFVGSSQRKSYRISSEGAIDVMISNISLSGDTDSFSITQFPSLTVSYGSPEIIEIEFNPASAGTKTALVEITNNDSDEGSYTFTIEGEGICLNESYGFSPSSGPPGTIVTVTGTDLNSASATYNGLPVSITHSSHNELELLIPQNVQSGHITITNGSGCNSIIPFTVIGTQVGGCEGGTALSEIFISEVTDATYGNLSFIELFNATGGIVNLGDYSLRVYPNGSTSTYSEQSLAGFSIDQNGTFVIAIGTSGALCEAIEGTYHLESTSLFGLNTGPGRDDYIGLYRDGHLIDEWGVFGSDNWASSSIITGDRGFNFRRSKQVNSLPEIPYNPDHWTIIDWFGSGIESCITNNYSDLGTHDFSTGSPPFISVEAFLPETLCDRSLSLTLEAEEGFLNGKPLRFKWYVLAPDHLNWTEVPDNELYEGVESSSLQITNTYDLDGYQYFCKVMEEDESCFTASESVRLRLKRSFWNGHSWSNGIPDAHTIAVISADYYTEEALSFNSCQLFVDSNAHLNIGLNDYVEVEQDVVAYGEISVETSGALVQKSSSGIIENYGLMQVNKTTSVLETIHDYTYWSSPVNSPLVGEALANANPNRRYWFDARNYLDEHGELNNDNSTSHPPDDVDDDGNVWTLTSSNESMVNGFGYAATHSTQSYTGSGQYSYSFVGTFNTGTIEVDVYRNDHSMEDNNWNLLGNPYPSAVNIQEFFNENAYAFNPTSGALEGVLYLWSQSTPPNSTNNGNQSSNFSQDDYITVNASGSVAANSSGVTNNGYIASGQGFFTAMHDEATVLEDYGDVKRSEVRFTNSMRDRANNDQFFRSGSENTHNKIWLNISGEGGLFCQMLVSYLPGATAAFDGAIYDAQRTALSSKPSLLYSLIDNHQQRFVIQGKAESDLHLNETIKLGFETVLDSAMIYSISIGETEGNFFNTHPVYLFDAYMNELHDLRESNYHFTSEAGVFLDRFFISFLQGALSVNEQQGHEKQLSIYFDQKKDVYFNLSASSPMEKIQIYSLTGQLIYNLSSSGFSAVHQLPLLSTGPFIVRVTLKNGGTLIRKALKP